MALTGSLEKMIITAFSDSNFRKSVGQMSVYINPEKYSQNYDIRYAETQAQGSSGTSPEFIKAREKLEMELVLDGTGAVPSPLPGVIPFTENGIAEQVDGLLKLVFDYNSNIHSPNYLQLSWGTLVFRCRLVTFKITYSLFKPDGTPLRARVACSFLGYTSKAQLAKQENDKSPDVTHLLTVRGGDTLPGMCFEVYGSSEYYVQVARANGLTSFRTLRPGTQLLFPPLGEAVV